MSNLIAGDIFEKIIDEVSQASQTDFEENGVSQQTLIELKQTWQQKLSSREIAQMPWDPKPAPPAANQTNGSTNAMSNGQSYGTPSNQAAVSNASRIKPEPTTDATYDNSNYIPPAMNPELARERAQNLLQQQYGNQASASLNAMQQQRGIALPGQQQNKAPGGLQLPGQNQQALQQQYAQQLKQQQAAQQPRIKAETDGASEYGNGRDHVASTDPDTQAWQALMAERRLVTAQSIAQNDALVRDQIAQMSQQLESGLLQDVPRKARSSANNRRKRKQFSQLHGIPQLDGEFSDDEKLNIKDEEDENAINSDLDSSGDEAANAEEDDDDIDSMLCTYDKVQRVKNKWKCTLKDGVLSANGKEYLFHKAQGEFEW